MAMTAELRQETFRHQPYTSMIAIIRSEGRQCKPLDISAFILQVRDAQMVGLD